MTPIEAEQELIQNVVIGALVKTKHQDRWYTFRVVQIERIDASSVRIHAVDGPNEIGCVVCGDGTSGLSFAADAVEEESDGVVTANHNRIGIVRCSAQIMAELDARSGDLAMEFWRVFRERDRRESMDVAGDIELKLESELFEVVEKGDRIPRYEVVVVREIGGKLKSAGENSPAQYSINISVLKVNR